MMRATGWLLTGLIGAMAAAPVVAAPISADPGTGSPATTGSSGSGAAALQAKGSYNPPPEIRAGQPTSVLAFPFGFAAPEVSASPAPAPAAPPDSTITGIGAGQPAAPTEGLTLRQQVLSDYVTAAVKAGFLSSPYYAVVTYHATSSLIKRATNDEILSSDQVAGVISPATGAVDVEKAKVIANRLSLQTALVGTIDVKSDVKKNASEITLEVQLLNSSTGEILRSAAVSGAAAGALGVPIETVEERAALEAVQKMLPALGIELVPYTPAAAPTATKAGKKTKEQRRAEAEARKATEAAARAQADAARRAAREAAKAGQPAPAVATTVAPPAAAVTAPSGPRIPETAPELVGGGAAAVPGAANAAGQPVPYGYAVVQSESALPPRTRTGLKIPAWLGVAGFLTGVAFLF